MTKIEIKNLTFDGMKPKEWHNSQLRLAQKKIRFWRLCMVWIMVILVSTLAISTLSTWYHTGALGFGSSEATFTVWNIIVLALVIGIVNIPQERVSYWRGYLESLDRSGYATTILQIITDHSKEEDE